MAFKLDPPPDPSTPLTSYPWTIWFTKLYRWVATYVGTVTGGVSLGAGVPVINIDAGTEDTLAFNSLVAGSGITISGPADGNIVISSTGGGGGGIVDSVVAGTGISVDSSDPANPVVSATGGGGGGILPVVTGEVPPVFVYLEDGSLVYTEII